MQTNAAIRVGTLGAVLQIALHRTTYCRQLTAYLVVTTCLQINLQKRIIISANEGFVIKDGLLRIFCARLCYKGFIEFLIAHKPIF